MQTRREIVNGTQRAVFIRQDGQGWQPDWFYDGDAPMLRFKDHEWLSIGHVHPQQAETVEDAPDGGALFHGLSHYGQTAVPWTVQVTPDREAGGFAILVTFTPAASIELLEAWTAFEAPYVYDGSETATTVIGMNPVVRWQAGKRQTPPIWDNPAWCYARPQSARRTAACHTPYLCQSLTGAQGQPERFITLVGDWNVCTVHDLFATPSRAVPAAQAADGGTPVLALHGYKYLVGALNWSSAFAKDPNVLFAGGQSHRQRVLVDCARACPGGSFDDMLYRAWTRAEQLSRPADGRVAAFDRATARGVRWGAATGWLRDVFCEQISAPDLYVPGKGIVTYAVGSRPKAGGDASWYWWPQWAGLLHYRALLTQDSELAAWCDRHDQSFTTWARDPRYFDHIALGATLPATLNWLVGAGRGSVLEAAFRIILAKGLEHSCVENGRSRTMDSGAQATIAEMLLLGYELTGESAMRDQGLLLLSEMATKLDGNFWEFNVGRADSLVHGGQIRSLGHGHAVAANAVAHRLTGDAAYLRDARRFARYLLAVSYATHNSSRDPDFDWRGWCNGSNAGRDQIAEFPPWETQNGLLCLATLMADCDLADGFYDVLWYIGRTGLAQFPAARTLKRILDTDMAVHYVPRAGIASERDFYDHVPYLAYENPHDQTLLASYQGTDCLVGDFVYGGGLARTADVRVAALVPGAARMDPAEAATRRVHFWNPTPAAIETEVILTWAAGRQTRVPVTVPSRQVLRQTYTA